jgi:hypothetical protein
MFNIETVVGVPTALLVILTIGTCGIVADLTTSILSHRKLESIHIQMDGRMTQLLDAVTASSKAEGVSEGIATAKAEQVEGNAAKAAETVEVIMAVAANSKAKGHAEGVAEAQALKDSEKK